MKRSVPIAVALGGALLLALALWALRFAGDEAPDAVGIDARPTVATDVRGNVRLSVPDEAEPRAPATTVDGEPAVAQTQARTERHSDLEVSGRVVDGTGAHLAAFRILVETETDRFERPFESPDGTFQLSGLPAGQVILRASATLHIPSGAHVVTLPEPDAYMELVLLRAGEVAGFVLDPVGRPTAGAEVVFEPEMGESYSCLTGEDGRFRLSLILPGDYGVHADVEEFAPSEEFQLRVPPGRSPDELELFLRAGARLVGEVYDSSGVPVADEGVDIVHLSAGRNFNVHTDERGTFALEGLEPGSATVQVFLVREGDDSFDEFRVLAESVELVDGRTSRVVLGGARASDVRVHGRVTRSSEPVHEAMLVAIGDGASNLGTIPLAETDGEGMYEVVVGSPGPYTFLVAAGGDLDEGLEYEVNVPGGTRDHRLDFDLPDVRLAGVIVGPSGEPLSDIRVTLAREEAISWLTRTVDRYFSEDTDDRGRFVFENLQPGIYTLRANDRERGRRGSADFGRWMRSGLRVEEGRAQELSIRLEPGTKLKGLVVDGEGDPVPEAAIFARGEDGAFLSLDPVAVSKADGSFAALGLPPGELTLVARTLRGASAETPLRIRAGAGNEVRLAVVPASLLILSLEDRKGRGVRGRFRVFDASGRECASVRQHQDSDMQVARGLSTGGVLVGPLHPGSYSIVAEAGGRSIEHTVTLAGTAEVEVRLRLD